ncbi:MAG: hemolysin family protein [Candidatus Thermoplasmatota archaeon]|nr:hemolysin family protein [Candidatus Thermoplasmatota archaeon]
MNYLEVVINLLNFLSIVSNVGDDLGNPELEWGRITIFLILALGVSFLCSLLEAIILSVTWSHIEILSKDDKKSGKRLRELKEDIDVPLAAILTLNTISHTIGAAGVGSEFNKLGNEWFTAASIILTILILVFSEIIPKTLGAIYWKRLAPSSAYLLDAMIWITWPIVLVLNSFSKRISEGNEDQKEMTREEMIAVAEMGENQGALEKQETQVIKNLLTMDKILAEDVMTPSTVMLTFQRNEKVGKIVDEHSPIPFSRIPVREENLDDIIGVVFRSKIMELYGEGNTDIPMENLISELSTVSPEDSIATLLDEFLKKREHIFLVVDEYGTTQGIITLEDAVETLLGAEIVDESDSVEDMRQLARELWEKRRKRKTNLKFD